MDKNVSSVDLDELLKARQELNNEKGVETDPNMYSDYNPNRESEEKSASEAETEEDAARFENSYEDVIIDSGENLESNSLEETSDEYIKSLEADLTGESKSEEKNNLDKYDMFAAFEVKENANYHSEVNLEKTIKEEDSIERTTNLEKIEEELLTSSDSNVEYSDELVESDDGDKAIESAVESIDNAEDLAEFLDNLLDDIENDDGVEEIENQPEEDKSIEEDEPKEILSALAEIDVESKIEEDETTEDEAESVEEEVKETHERIDRLSALMKQEKKIENESEDVVDESEETQDETISDKLDESVLDNEFDKFLASDNEEAGSNVEETEEKEETVDGENDEIAEESEDDSNLLETDESTQEDNFDVGIDYIGEILGRKKTEEQKPAESVEIESYDASKARPTHPKLDNSVYNEDTEIITDYNQLREVLQKELRESELASQEKVEEEDDSVKYAMIEEFKFINEIATDDFKNSDRFSYILGKDERGEMVYGNFREHYNIAIFGRNDDVVNSFLNSMVLSLCLKNSTDEINFVMLDSDINSPFDIYNKSSYLYFNRIAKTNKEILDTLIEVTKELDERYNKLADVGLTNVEQYNDMASETVTKSMPNLVVVFNNYTSASQATYIDKINACLYQILKFGRIVGIYVALTAKLPIETNQVNYNLSSRISFKSDKDPKYNVGIESVAGLPDENDAIYFNISKNTTVHIKTATVTDTELDLIIKELEE